MDRSAVKYKMVPIDKLQLDVKNPRIAQWVEMYGDEVSEDAMRLALQRGGSDDKVAGPSYRSLQESIKTNGGVIYPVIVNREPNGRLLVIEGNTRTLIYKGFRRAGVDGNWDLIPAIVYENMSADQIDAIRLQAHLVGARDWDPYSKAKYLDMLRNTLHLPWAQVVDYGGGNQRELERLVAAYNDMETYYKPALESDQDFDYTRFSGFVELQHPRVLQALITSGHNKSDFAKWINEKKLYPLETVRQLPRILQNAETKRIFLKEGAQEAIRVLDTLEKPAEVPLEKASVGLLAREIYNRINAIPYSEIVRLRGEPDTEEKDVIRYALDALASFWNDITAESE